VATGFFLIHLPIKDHILSRETARLVLIFRKESAGWKISHSSISIPYHLVRAGEIYPLQELVERNQFLEKLIAERTTELSDKLQKLEAATATISWLARTDDLTGLHNRRSFNEIFLLALSAARRHGHPLSLISIDLDHFKVVNDTLGHSVGDLVLKEFARLMLKILREEDLCARWGGEEFIILLAHTAGDAAAALAERMRSSFAQNPGSAAPLAMTASFGVAELQEGEEGAALIRRADDALYCAKQAGRNRVVKSDR
jgi:diguanylate cyclase (GGDEF)-like protein